MEVTGKIIVALPEVSGTSKAGNVWKKRQYVLETQDNYPTKIAFEFFGERADQYPLSVGEVVKLSFDIDSHEYNGRWFTSIRGWKADKVDGSMSAAPASAPADFGAPAPAPAPTFTPSADANDDLPF
ncbi:MAG: DUF3127 domain-containing protein [Muribaculaceae bacterium]|nr:DUF3127 domain-containing protein [Muribaculaceae bacterium]